MFASDSPFLSDILARPDDPTPRRRYAAHLRRSDPDSRTARLIEVQCRLAEVTAADAPLTPSARQEVARLAVEERTLLPACRADWLARLGTLVPSAERLTFRLGLPHHLALAAADLYPAGRRLFEAAPTLRHLTLSSPADGRPADAERLFASPLLTSLDGLLLRGPWGDSAARAAVASPHLRRLRLLDLAGCEVGPDAAVRVAVGLPDLTRLVLSGNPVGPAGADLVAAGPALLDLDEAGFDDAAAEAAGGRSTRVRELSLLDNPGLTAAGVRHLLDAPGLGQVALALDPVPGLDAALDRHNRRAGRGS